LGSDQLITSETGLNEQNSLESAPKIQSGEISNMNNINFKSLLSLCLATVLLALPVAQADEHAGADADARVMAISVEAEVTAVDHPNREVTLRGPTGELTTVTAGDQIERFEDFAVGDIVSATYIASLEGELREPTADEIAEPWIELDAAAKADLDMDPGAIVGRVIQAVCTIEGLNRVTGTVMVKDPRGKFHVIGDVEPEKMEGVTLGSTLVLTYSEAVAVALVKKDAAAE
jgi:hypothetical protein